MMMTTIFRDLPNDLVEEEILCYVPATYLKRLQSTCKRWNRLFNGDRRFARKHSDKAAKQLLRLTVKNYRIFPTIIHLHGRCVERVEFKSELSLVDSQSMDSAQFDIARAYHCGGLLICISKDASRFVVWNPFTGETRWFQPNNSRGLRFPDFVLGYYYQEDKKKKMYKILNFSFDRPDAEIYEFSSDSWRIVDPIKPPDWRHIILYHNVSLKGNTYWFVSDTQNKVSLLKFDFQTEKTVLVPLPLPYQSGGLFGGCGVSAVGEEKLSVLLQRYNTSKTEIWVTNKIDETTPQVVSWSKVLALDLCPDLQLWQDDVHFVFDEEKKVITMGVPWFENDENDPGKHMMYIVGEDGGEVTQVELVSAADFEFMPEFITYVPSLVQIEQAGGKKKRGDLSNMNM